MRYYAAIRSMMNTFLKIKPDMTAILLILSLFMGSGCAESNADLPRLFLPLVGGEDVIMMGQGFVLHEGASWHYTLIELRYPGIDPAYGIWIRANEDGRNPAVLMTNPYDGITWNGDEPPEGSMEYPPAHYVEIAYPFLLNGFGVLHLFCRFYAGGNLENDVNDVVAGLRFLAGEPGVDPDRIGIHGASWGGFEALYGAAAAPPGVVPAAGVALYPPSDFPGMVDYINVEIPAEIADPDARAWYEVFFQPYLDRIFDTGGWESWTSGALCGRLATPFLVIHDEWDMLVPFAQSTDLVSEAGGIVEPLFFLQKTDLDMNAFGTGWGHGQLRLNHPEEPYDPYVYGMLYTFLTSYLGVRLGYPDRALLVGYDGEALNDFYGYLREFKCAEHRDMDWAAVRLLDLADPRVVMVELNPPYPVVSGAEAVAKGFSDMAWGTAEYWSHETIDDALASGLPSCP